MPGPNITNGLNVDDLNNSIDATRANPQLGKYQFRAKNRWVDGAHCRTTINDFYAAGQEDTFRSKTHVLEGDEPPALLGQDYGPNATEALLHALGACLNASFIFQATAQGIKIDELEFELEGDIDLNGFLGVDESARNGFQEIRVTCMVKADAPREKLEELCELAQKRSPVFDIVSHPVPVSVQLKTEVPVGGWAT